MKDAGAVVLRMPAKMPVSGQSKAALPVCRDPARECQGRGVSLCIMTPDWDHPAHEITVEDPKFKFTKIDSTKEAVC